MVEQTGPGCSSFIRDVQAKGQVTMAYGGAEKMSTVENKKLVQEAFAAWARGEGNAVFNLLADDVHWTVIGSTPVSRTYLSKREFFDGAVKPLGEKLAGTIQPTVRAVYGDDDTVIVQWDGRATGKNGTLYNQTYCWVMRIQGGKVREGTAYLDTELISQLWK
jgi:ketosteroid isomerase-like protein